MTDASIHRARRERLAALMGEGVAIVPTAPERARNRDTHYPYRHDSHFYYLTGFPEPDAVLVLLAGDAPRSILFCRERDEEREIWDGHRWGPERAREAFGVDEALSIATLEQKLPELLENQPLIHFGFGADGGWDSRVMGWVNAVRDKSRAGIEAPAAIRDVRTLVDEMRLVKDAHEIDVMARAAVISARAHRRAMRSARPGRREFEVEAELLHEFRAAGAQAPAYASIVAAGANACVLHYVSNEDELRDGDLLLIDAGCELDGYASDITRSFPVNGRFSGPQRELYELVLEAQAAAIAAVAPGRRWNEPHDAAVGVLARGFVDLGLCKGSVESVIESGDYRRFYMHRTGHWLGMDVHDVGEYKRDGQWRVLEPGMALTVEPGCYVRPADEVPEAYWNIGIRIEDDAVVTAEGCRILTSDAPKTVAEVEAWMAGG